MNSQGNYYLHPMWEQPHMRYWRHSAAGRGPGGPQHDAASPFKRSRPQSPSSSTMQNLQRQGPAYYQDPRFGMAVAAVAAGGYGSIYRDPFQPPPHQQVAEQHAREVREQFTRDRIPVSAATSREADLFKQRRPTLLDYGTHTQGGVDRARYRPDLSAAYGQHFRPDNMGNIQGAPQPNISSAPDPGPQAPKRPRLTVERPDLAQPLRIDVNQTEPKREPAYNPQVEAISPTLPPEETLKVQKIKDDLLQNISKIDREIAMVEQQIQNKLKKKHQQEEAANKQKEEVDPEDTPDTNVDLKHQSIAQIIYAENRKKAQESHHKFTKMGPKVDLPLYNQPSDAAVYHENKKNYALFKPKLIAHFKKRHEARKNREMYLTQEYDRRMQEWVKKVEKWENNPKRKAKEAKQRDAFEKIFPELKKARDDKLSRSGTRAGMAPYARSEAELEQIMDGLNEQEEVDRKMHNLAVIPPMMLDAKQRSLKFVNKNGLLKDCMEEYKERKYINVWTTQEKQVFKEKYLQHPKNFGLIASFLEKKNTMDCVEYYYRSKKSENYKQMLRKQTVKKKRQQQKQQQQQQQQPVIQKEEVMEVISTSEVSQTPSTSTADETVNVVTSTAPSGPPVRPDTGPLNIPSSSAVSTTSGKEKEDDDKDMMDDSSEDNDIAKEGEGGVHPCAICKTQLEHYGLSRPLTGQNCELYGIPQGQLKADMRVCSNCRCKSVRRRYTQCPVPTCKTPKRKVKRLRPFPTRWAEIPISVKEPLIRDLQLTEDINKCCSACFNRIARKLGSTMTQPLEPVIKASSEQTPESTEKSMEQPMEATTTQDSVDSTRWADEEIELAKKGLREFGRDWVAIASIVRTKSDAQCKMFYSNFRRKYHLDMLISDNKVKPMDRGVGRIKEEDNRTVSVCESMASTVTAPSDGEQILSDNDENRDSDDSGTASAPSPQPLEERDLTKDQPDSSGRPVPGDLTALMLEVPNSLVNSQKSLSTSQGSLRSIPDNDSTATLSADEMTGAQGDKQPPQHHLQSTHPGSIKPSALPVCTMPSIMDSSHAAARSQAQVGAIGLGIPGRPASNPSQSPGNSNHSFPSRPGSRQSPATTGQGLHHSRPNSRPSNHEVPIIREANPNQVVGNVIDFSQGMKPYSPYQPGREQASQPRRPSSALSEPGHRSQSPHVPVVTPAHLLLGLDPSRGTTPPQEKKLKPATCVRDLIHSAIERNLSQDAMSERPMSTQDRPRSTDAGYRPSSQPMPLQIMPHEMRPTDLRKDSRAPNYPDHRGSPYQIQSRGMERDPRDLMRGDQREMRGPPSSGMDLSMRQPDGADKGSHGYKGDPRDFDPHSHHHPSDPYRGQTEDPQQRKVIAMVTPPPAHSHRRSPYPMQDTLKARPEEKSPSLYQERQTMSPSVRVVAPASSPYSPLSGDARIHASKGGIPPPPPLINSASPRIPKSPPTSHMQILPSGSITHGTPVGHAHTTTTPSTGGRPQQSMVARGSITQGTPIREAGMGRGMPHHDPGAPQMPGQGQFDSRMMEQAQVRGLHPQMYDPRMLEQMRMPHPGYQQPPFRQYQQVPNGNQAPPSEYSTKQTIMSDFMTARQMGHRASPTEKEQRDPRDPRDPRDLRDPREQRDPRDQRDLRDARDPRDQSPRAQELGPSQNPKGYPVDQRMGYQMSGPGGMMYIAPGQPQQPSSSRLSPRPTSSMASPRDDKSGSPWMMPGRPNMGAPSPGGHVDPSLQYQAQVAGRPSITQGTGRQSVITDSRNEDRYRPVPDSSGAHHSPRIGQQESYMQMPQVSGDQRRSPAVHPDYRQQQYEREREREQRERSEKEQQAIIAAKAKYDQGVQRYNEELRLKHQQEVEAARRVRSGDDRNKSSPKLSNATDLLKVFAQDPAPPQKVKMQDQSGKNKSMTAACLIDAIIVHQINQSTEDTPVSETPSLQSSKPLLKQEQKPMAAQSPQLQQQQQQIQQQIQHQQLMQQQQQQMQQQQQQQQQQQVQQKQQMQQQQQQQIQQQMQQQHQQQQMQQQQQQQQLQQYKQPQHGPVQGYPQGQPAQGYSPQGQPQLSGQPPYPGQPYPGQVQKGQQDSKSPPAQMAGKKRWMPATPPNSTSSFSPGASIKDPDSRPPSRPSSRGSGGTPTRALDSNPRPSSQGPPSQQGPSSEQEQDPDKPQMTLGDHINTIILMDYERKKAADPGGVPAKSFLSRINGSTQPPSSKDSSSSSPVSSTSSVTSESTTTWATAPPGPVVSSGQMDGQSKTPPAFPGHKKFNKWRQANEQASSSGNPYEVGGAISQSGSEDQGSRSQPQEGEWRQMRPDQSHSPGVSGVGAPTSPPGQADSSSSSMSASSVEVKSAMRKGLGGVQDSEVSTLEYVKNKIAQCLQDEPKGQPPGQVTESQQPVGRSPHLPVMAQPSHSSTKQRTQSPVSSQMGISKENSHKHPRPESRQSGSVSTSGEPHTAMPLRQQDLSSVSPSSSSQLSPDQHNTPDEDSSRGSNYQKPQSQAQSPVSSAGDGREQVHSSQHPQRKGRMFSRPRSRMEQEEVEPRKGVATPQREALRQSQRMSPSASMQEGGRATTSSDKKGPRSEYDFPDSPDDEALGGKSLSSYMALSSSTRSPRRGVVDSSENRGQSAGDASRDGDGNVESSEDVAHSISKACADSGSGKDNEAQGFESFSSEQAAAERMGELGRKSDENQVSSRLGIGSSSRKQSLEADDGSIMSPTSADSTDRLMVDESANIDSSSGAEVSSAMTGSRRSSKSSRESDNSSHGGSDFGNSSEHVSHSRQSHRSRSPRSYPQSSSDLTSSMPAGSSMGFSRRAVEAESASEGRDQEPQPLLSSQYETLSDDEQS